MKGEEMRQTVMKKNEEKKENMYVNKTAYSKNVLSKNEIIVSAQMVYCISTSGCLLPMPIRLAYNVFGFVSPGESKVWGFHFTS
jgi:hypothetical protein